MVLGKLRWYDYLIKAINYFLLTVLSLATLLPCLNIVAKSMSSNWAVVSGKVYFIPVAFTVDTYIFALSGGHFFRAFNVSVFITIVGTFFALLFTCMTAYPLSRSHLRGRKVILYAWVIVMLFSGGMIPNYLLYKGLRLLDTVFAMILPAVVSAYNLFIIKNYFETLPDALEEAARIDGASNFRVLFQIIIPVSIPMLVTIGLFYMVGYWNDYFTARMYITTPSLKPLQLYLYELITYSQQVLENTGAAMTYDANDRLMNVTPDSTRAATIVLTTLPILMVYPFLQKYFIKGIVIGSVKG